jgi:hypothetical protein
MAIVYVVMLDVKYEGSTLRNLFSNENAARKYCAANANDVEYDDVSFSIHEMTVIDEVNVTEADDKYDHYDY